MEPTLSTKMLPLMAAGCWLQAAGAAHQVWGLRGCVLCGQVVAVVVSVLLQLGYQQDQLSKQLVIICCCSTCTVVCCCGSGVHWFAQGWQLETEDCALMACVAQEILLHARISICPWNAAAEQSQMAE